MLKSLISRSILFAFAGCALTSCTSSQLLTAGMSTAIAGAAAGVAIATFSAITKSVERALNA